MIVDRRAEVEILQQDLQGRAYDMEYAIGWLINDMMIWFQKYNYFSILHSPVPSRRYKNQKTHSKIHTNY